MQVQQQRKGKGKAITTTIIFRSKDGKERGKDGEIEAHEGTSFGLGMATTTNNAKK